VAAAKLSRHFPETPFKLASGELTLDSAADLWRAFQEEKRRVRPSVIQAEGRAQKKAIAPPLPFSVPLEIAAHSAACPGPKAPTRPQVPPEPQAPTLNEMRGLYEQALGKSRNETQTAIESWKQERSGEFAPKKLRTTSITLFLSGEDELAWNRLRDLLSHRLGNRSPEAALRWLMDQGLEKLDPVRIQARQDARASMRSKTTDSRKADAPDRPENAAVVRSENCAQRQNDNKSHSSSASRRTDEMELQNNGYANTERTHIPAALKRRVWIRCESRCVYVDSTTGRVCGSTAFLDIDHILPLSRGGTNVEANLRLACASHNRRRENWERGE
jgi:5-methylcytosine-specific restriction endonuclease McrA